MPNGRFKSKKAKNNICYSMQKREPGNIDRKREGEVNYFVFRVESERAP